MELKVLHVRPDLFTPPRKVDRLASEVGSFTPIRSYVVCSSEAYVCRMTDEFLAMLLCDQIHRIDSSECG